MDEPDILDRYLGEHPGLVYYYGNLILNKDSPMADKKYDLPKYEFPNIHPLEYDLPGDLPGLFRRDIKETVNIPPYEGPVDIPYGGRKALNIPYEVFNYFDIINGQKVVIDDQKKNVNPKLEMNMVSLDLLKSLLDLYEQLKDQNKDMAKGIKLAIQAGINEFLGEDRPGYFTGEERLQEKERATAHPAHIVQDFPARVPARVADIAQTPLTADEHDLGKAGEKIQAIKAIRARLGMGLKEAKDLYEKFYPINRR